MRKCMDSPFPPTWCGKGCNPYSTQIPTPYYQYRDIIGKPNTVLANTLHWNALARVTFVDRWNGVCRVQ